MRKSKKNRTNKNKTIKNKSKSKCVYTDEARRLLKVIKALKKTKAKGKVPGSFTKTIKKK